MERIDVNLGERSYPILIGSGLLSDPDSFSLVAGRQVVVITNDTIAPLYADLLLSTLSQAGAAPALFVLPDGEQYKTLESFNAIMSFLLERCYGRDVLLVALGGGVIGDVVGFAAACYQRGVEFIQVPTTLLSQVDSSVGGKTGVNHPLGKNMIGAFYQPLQVVMDLNVLATLPSREFSAGMAEVIKYGIMADGDFFQWLELHVERLVALEPAALTHCLRCCCEIKARVVASDEKEAGVRALLNLGHTFGHAIEAQMGFGNWLHGEAVAVGMVLAAKAALLRDEFSLTELDRIIALLEKVNLPTQPPSTMGYDNFIRHMQRDKKVIAGQLRFVLPRSIGQAIVAADVSTQTLQRLFPSS